MMKRMNMDDRLAATRFDSDDVNAHIVIDKEACRTCTHKACTYSCPAERYKWDDDNDVMTFDHVGCLECGNCRLVCERLNERRPGYDWNYPNHGKGFLAKEG